MHYVFPVIKKTVAFVGRMFSHGLENWTYEILSWPPPPAIHALLEQIKAIQNALEQSGEPVIRYHKVNGILNALAMQIEDGGDNSAVVARLFEALEAAVGAYLSGPRASDILVGVKALRQAEAQRRS